MRWSGTTEIFFFFNSMSGTRILLFLSFSFHFFFSSFFSVLFLNSLSFFLAFELCDFIYVFIYFCGTFGSACLDRAARAFTRAALSSPKLSGSFFLSFGRCNQCCGETFGSPCQALLRRYRTHSSNATPSPTMLYSFFLFFLF